MALRMARSITPTSPKIASISGKSGIATLRIIRANFLAS